MAYMAGVCVNSARISARCRGRSGGPVLVSEGGDGAGGAGGVAVGGLWSYTQNQPPIPSPSRGEVALCILSLTRGPQRPVAVRLRAVLLVRPRHLGVYRWVDG